MRSAKQGDSVVGYCRDTYTDREVIARRELERLSEFEQHIRDREIIAERERTTAGLGRTVDPTGFCADGWI